MTFLSSAFWAAVIFLMGASVWEAVAWWLMFYVMLRIKRAVERDDEVPE